MSDHEIKVLDEHHTVSHDLAKFAAGCRAMAHLGQQFVDTWTNAAEQVERFGRHYLDEPELRHSNLDAPVGD